MASAASTLTAEQARQFNAGVALLRQGAIDRALAIASAIAGTTPDLAEVQHLLATCHARAGNHEAAEQAFLRSLEIAPAQPEVLANLATLLRGKGRMEDAVRNWRHAVAVAPRFGQAWLDLGLAELDTGNVPAAVQALRRATELQPGSARAWCAAGRAHRAAEDLDAAEAAYRQALHLDPGHASAWVNLGSVLRLLARPRESLQCFQRARAAGMGGPELDDAETGALLDAGHVHRAIEQARRLCRKHPGWVPGQVTLANLLWEHGCAEGADEDPLAGFRAAAEARSADRNFQVAFVQFLLKARQGEEALQRIRRLRAQGEQPLLWWLEADILERLDRSADAAPLYERVRRTPLGNTCGFFNAYTRHLLRSGQWRAAAQCASDAILCDPQSQEAWANLGTSWRLLSDPREEWLCDYQRLVGIVEVPEPEGYDMAGFLDVLRRKLDPMHMAVREPVQQSLRGGSQTAGRLFGRADPVFRAAHGALVRAVEGWVAALPSDPTHPFLARKRPKVHVAGSWSVRLWSSGLHVNHIHPEGWMSSAFYVALPPAMCSADDGDTAGCLQLGQPPVELALKLPPRRIVRPEAGQLILFPSYMWHGTLPFADAEPRLTVAFDMLPAG